MSPDYKDSSFPGWKDPNGFWGFTVDSCHLFFFLKVVLSSTFPLMKLFAFQYLFYSIMNAVDRYTYDYGLF